VSVQRDRWVSYAGGRRPAGGRLFPALVIVLVLLGVLGWSAEHPVSVCSCGPNISFSRNQPGLRPMSGPLATVLSQLPVRVQVAPGIGVAVGVYRTRRFALVLYGQRSLFGVFRFTAREATIGLWRSQPARGRLGVQRLYHQPSHWAGARSARGGAGGREWPQQRHLARTRFGDGRARPGGQLLGYARDRRRPSPRSRKPPVTLRTGWSRMESDHTSPNPRLVGSASSLQPALPVLLLTGQETVRAVSDAMIG
jgi:hypothetical protein